MKRFLVVFLWVISTSVLWLSAASPQSEATEIEGNLYTNNTLGFSFQFTQGWVADEAVGGSSTLGGDTLILKTSSGDSSLSVFSEALPAGLPLEELAASAEQWLNEHQGHLPGMNMEVRGEVEQTNYGNTLFYRLNFRTQGRRNRVHHAAVVTVTPGKLIGFEAMAKNEKGVNQTLDALQSIKFFDAAFAAWQAIAGTNLPEDVIQLGAVFLERFPTNDIAPYVHKRMAFSYQQLNDYENLIIHGERTIELLSDDPDIRPMMALAFAERGDNNRAIDLAQQGLEVLQAMEKPADVPVGQWILRKERAISDSNYAQGLAYLKKSSGMAGGGEAMMKRAVEYLGEATESDPEFDAAYFRLGYAYTRLNEAELAIESYARAVASEGIASELAREQLLSILGFLKRDPSTSDQLVQEQRAYIDQKIAEKEAQAQQMEAEGELRMQQELQRQEMELQQQEVQPQGKSPY
jgi:tetratricopeptide (TPR) repeat protein